MSAAQRMIPGTEGYSPREKPAIMRIAEEYRMKGSKETVVQQINDWCSLVDREETRIVGITLGLTYESRGYNYGSELSGKRDLNDYQFTKKLLVEGEIALLAEALGKNLAECEILSARYDVEGDGNYRVIVGIEVPSFQDLPDCLPEYTGTLTVPGGRFVKMLINETNAEGRIGYGERMQADEYFVGEFRKDSKYVYNPQGLPLNTYAQNGEMLTKYEPVKLPLSDKERFESLRFKPVVLPAMKIACSITAPDDEEFVITKYFGIEQQLFATEAAQYYLHDYYGFPLDSGQEGQPSSCFGTRVSTFEGLPDGVEKVTLPGGIYLHITQLEFNGDNPSIPYEVAFHHLNELFLGEHPQYDRDWNRQVIARFRQANCASVFVPIVYKI